MKITVELRVDDAIALYFFCCKLEELSDKGLEWKRWKQEPATAHETPDLSIIDATHLNWHQVTLQANQCKGETVLLWGSKGNDMGLACLDKNFSKEDLLAHLPTHQEKYLADQAQTALASPIPRYNFMATIPMPVLDVNATVN